MRKDEGGVETDAYGFAYRRTKELRRERIATACLQGALANATTQIVNSETVINAIKIADKLIEELDK